MRPPATIDASIVEGTWNSNTLALVDFIDTNLGAAEWTQRQIAMATVLILGMIRVTCKDAYNVNWYAFLHGIASGYLSLMAVWVSLFAATPLTGTPEPLRSIVCEGPLTSLHRIVPAITMGYGLFDILDGFEHGIDFLLHGVATFTVMAYFCEYDLAEVILPMLMMEISTPHLHLMRVTFLNETQLAVNMGMFAFTFFLFRLIVCPYLWWGIFTTTWEHRDDPVSQACLPWHFKYVVFFFGMFFNCLNAFWAFKIVKKIMRKVTGKEKVKDKNDLKDR